MVKFYIFLFQKKIIIIKKKSKKMKILDNQNTKIEKNPTFQAQNERDYLKKEMENMREEIKN